VSGPGAPERGGDHLIRTARPADIPALRAIFRANGGDGDPVAGGADVVGPYLAHLVTHHRVLVTEEDGGVVAFGAAVDTGRLRMLADLFVLPDRLGRGLGRPLLAALYGEATVRATFSSDDPRALPLYTRAGMAPLWINLYVEGPVAALPAVSPSLRTRTIDASEASALEAAWTGVARPVDHAFWASQADADAFAVETSGRTAGIGYARARQRSTARAMDRLVIAPDADPFPVALAALARAGRSGTVETCVLGPNPLLRVLLDAGFRVNDHDQLHLSDPALVDPLRLLPNPGML